MRHAPVAESVDAADLKSADLKVLRVQVPPGAPGAEVAVPDRKARSMATSVV